MGMIEVDYQIVPYAEIRVGSEEVIPWDGWPYEDILPVVTNNPTITPKNLARQIVDLYVAFYGSGRRNTLSAIDLSRLNTLITTTNTFGQDLRNGLPTYYAQIRDSRSNSQEFRLPCHIDLYHFAELVRTNVPDAVIRASATSVMSSLNNIVIAEGHGPRQPNAHGVAIYFPSTRESYEEHIAQYRLERFAVDTQWDEFIDAYYAIRILVPGQSLSSTISQGETQTLALDVREGTAFLEFRLDWEGSDLDLHVYDPRGNHVGFNYETCEVETEIFGASYSGKDVKPEWVHVTSPEAGTWIVEIYGYQVVEPLESYIIVGNTHTYVPATINIDPDTLNLKSQGRWITAYIELPEGCDVGNIDVGTVALEGGALMEGILSAELWPTEIGDHDGDGIPDLMVKFDRAAVQDIVNVGDSIELTIIGRWNDIPFRGSDNIRVTWPGKIPQDHGNKPEVPPGQSGERPGQGQGSPATPAGQGNRGNQGGQKGNRGQGPPQAPPGQGGQPPDQSNQGNQGQGSSGRNGQGQGNSGNQGHVKTKGNNK